MKAFEKWKNHHSPGEFAYQKWEEGWRAALEHILTTKEDYPSGWEIFMEIEKELEETG